MSGTQGGAPTVADRPAGTKGPLDTDRLHFIETLYGRRCGRSFICAALDETEHQLRLILASIDLEDRARARQMAAELQATATSWAALDVALAASRLSRRTLAAADMCAAAADIACAIAKTRRALYRLD
jgi:hypothetical protein